MTGLLGVGKTQLAAAYARAKLAEGWQLVAWINAEELGGVLAGLAAVAAAVGVGSGAENAEAAGKAVRQWLETGGDRCLLVFDNATDLELLQRFIPVTGAAQVIITSNQQSMANLGRGVPVDVFSEREALAFFAERTNSADTEGAGAVAAELGYLPLALAQAAAVVSDQHLTYGTYLDRLRAMPVDDLLVPVEAGQYRRGVAAAVLLSLDGIRAADRAGVCTAVMQLLAVLSPVGLRRDLLYSAGRQGLLTPGRHGVLKRDRRRRELGAEPVDRALARLAKTSLLTFSVDGSSVSVHRLVMRVTREQMAAGNSLVTVCTAAARLLQGLAESFRQTWHQDRAAVRDLVEQIMALYQSSADCPADGELARRIIQLRGWAVWFLLNLGDSAAQSILIAEPLQADQERMLGSDHPDTMTNRSNLATAYQAAGRAAEAIPLLEKVLADQERVLGADHPNTMTTRNNLASGYQAAGRAAEAIPLLEKVLADQKRVLNADHPDTMTTRNNLASGYQDVGRAAEAIPLYEQVLSGRTQVLGAEHPDTMISRNNLASGYQAAGRAAEAISLYEQNLADQERVLGADHPNTLGTRTNLATAYQAAGRAAEAISLYEQNLADQERVLGADHPNTLGTRTNLATAYQAAGRAAEAIPLLEQVLADQERVLGADHPWLFTVRNNLATAYQAAGRAAEAIPLLEQVLADRTRVLGSDHPDTMITRSNVANAYQAAGRAAEAIPLLEQVLAGRTRVLGAEHPKTLSTRNYLANAYRAADQAAKASSLREHRRGANDSGSQPSDP